MAQSTYQDICGDMTEAKFRAKARDYFRLAYSNFDDMVHLKGMYLAKMHEAHLYEVNDNMNDDSRFVKQRALKMAIRLRGDYFDHVKRYGYTHCCHIPRQHGDQISLLTEIVEQNKKMALFKAPPGKPNLK